MNSKKKQCSFAFIAFWLGITHSTAQAYHSPNPLPPTPAHDESKPTDYPESTETQPMPQEEASTPLPPSTSPKPQSNGGNDHIIWVKWLLTSIHRLESDGQDRLTLFALDFGFSLPVSQELMVSMDWGLAWASTHVRGLYRGARHTETYEMIHEHTEARNADLRFELRPWAHTHGELVIGLGAVVPLAGTPQSPANAFSQGIYDASLFAYEGYLAQRAAEHPWKYRPERTAVHLPIKLILHPLPISRITIESYGALGIRILGGTGDEFLFDLGGSIEGQLFPFDWFNTALRVSLVSLALGTRDGPALQSGVHLRFEAKPLASIPLRMGLEGHLGLSGPYRVDGPCPGWSLGAGLSLEPP
ncbi:MAG: hypothetical protein RMJ84_10075 [Sandaracinaceae bacterium]|nr:hypothetical protein [Sandaracinaceae bacterium]